MSVVRFFVLVGILSLLAAGVLAIASRAPADVRAPAERPTDPELGASFTEDEVTRHGAYRAPGYLSYVLGIGLQVVTLLLLVRGPGRSLLTWIERLPGGWPIHAALFAIVVGAILFLAGLAPSLVRGWANARAWGISVQPLGDFLMDQIKGLGIASVIGAVSAVVFFGAVRWQPRWWWVIGWAAFSVLTALLAFVYPVLITPLFFNFEPLEEGPLKTRLLALAEEAGVHTDEVLVADASRRTTSENAWVSGFGASRQLVLYDTLLEAGDEDETAFVVAHELGHQAEGHVLKNVLLSAVALFVGFGTLAWLAGRDGLWRWGGAEGIGDPTAIPLLLLFALVAGLLVSPLENWISRSFERRADAIAIELTDDPGTATRVFRRLAYSNLADLRPPRVAVWALFSHPPIPERIGAARAEAARSP